MGGAGAVLLAAGLSRRMGRNKLLLPYRGRPLAAHGFGALCRSSADEVLVVLGHEAEAVKEALEGAKAEFPQSPHVRFVVNPRYATGRASSVRAALEALPQEFAAALFLPADLAGVDAADVEAVLGRFRETGADLVVAADAGGRPSHPILFGRALFSDLSALQGDRSGRALLEAHWETAEKVLRTGPAPLDIDSEEDYRNLAGG